VLLVSLLGSGCAQANPSFITPSDRYHIVKPGDTLYSIGRAYDIPVDKLRLYNSITDDRIFVGQKIYLSPNPQPYSEYVTRREIPPEKYHLVEKGETVYRISKYYDLEIFDIMEYNGLTTFDIQVGQKIWLEPGHTSEAPAAPVPTDTTVARTPSPQPPVTSQVSPTDTFHTVVPGETLFGIARAAGMKVDELKAMNNLTADTIYVGQRLRLKPGAPVTPGSTAPPAAPVTEQRPPVAHRPGIGLYRPLEGGRVTSRFGMRDGKPHKGVDIAAPIGEPVYAVLDGKVVFSGQQRGYGNVIVLEHDDYVMTVYAHNDANLVRLGDTVTRGQPIATVGDTGSTTGSHLHFEYRVSGKAIDPEEVLPKMD